MPVTITTKPENYFFTDNVNGQRPTISTLEVTSLFQPEYIGRVVAEEMDNSSIIAQLMIQGRESMVSTDQIVWKEEDNHASVNVVEGTGIITRAGDNFTINAAAIPADAYDIDENRPDDAQWIVGIGMEFAVFDNTGKMNHGKITSISVDKKTITATIFGEGAVAWTIGTANLTVVFTGYNLDHCECAPCVGFRKYAPTRENTMFKDGECFEYCEETMAVEGSGSYDRFEVKGDFMNLDEELNTKQAALLERMEFAVAFGKRMTRAQATALGNVSLGMQGIFPTLDDRALKIQGQVETFADLMAITNYLKKQKVYSATMKCTDAQYAKLMNLVPPSSPYYIDPFTDNSDSMVVIGFKGFKFNGVTLMFKEYSALNQVSDNIGARYNFVIIPEGILTKVLNGKKEKVGYLNIHWFSAFGKAYKWYRDKEGEEKTCGSTKVDYVSKFTISLFHPEKWIIGVNA